MPARTKVKSPGFDVPLALARRTISEYPFELTEAEKKLLKDADWIDEEEADLILAMREERECDLGDCTPLREFARPHGFVKDLVVLWATAEPTV